MNQDVKEYLDSFSPTVRELAWRARALVFAVMPEIAETVYPAMNVIRYGTDGNRMAGLVCYLAPLKAGVNLGFIHGVSLPDPESLLEGTGKNLRHVKLRTAADVEAPALCALLEAARRFSGA